MFSPTVLAKALQLLIDQQSLEAAIGVPSIRLTSGSYTTSSGAHAEIGWRRGTMRNLDQALVSFVSKKPITNPKIQKLLDDLKAQAEERGTDIRVLIATRKTRLTSEVADQQQMLKSYEQALKDLRQQYKQLCAENTGLELQTIPELERALQTEDQRELADTPQERLNVEQETAEAADRSLDTFLASQS